MKYGVVFITRAGTLERAWVKSAVLTALNEEHAPDCAVEVLFTDNEGIRQLNAAHRDKDEPTDVLSFPLFDGDTPLAPEPDGSQPMLGSIVINSTRCREQAIEYGHSFHRELCYLTVHSVLHLLGYDHEEEEDKRSMREREEAILTQLKYRYPTQPRFFGFADAARGLWQGIRQERNVRVHISAAVSVSVLGVYLHIDRVSWALCALCFGLVIGFELCNSAIETLCNKVEQRSDTLIRRCKDIAAGAVLTACLASLGIAAVVFVRPELWLNINPVRTAIIGALLALTDTLFIFFGGSIEEELSI